PREARDALRRSGLVRTAVMFGDAVHARVAPGTEPEALARALRDEGLEVAGAERVEPSLEDVFIQLVGTNGAAAASETP
ncbi:MAG TPA: DUF4162 domain-containing protein, partial [Longimicrobiales bacterium]|nr:DUF4162 domain-containing protein [Longimicrobiales bacterium]